MCGIVAVDIQDISSEQIEHVRKLLIETEIRGKHASGISWFANKQINTIKKSVPITELLEEFDIYRCVDDNDGHLKMIAHIRYSTSELEFNQPIESPGLVTAHNGVITQLDPSLWDETFNLGEPTGKNDSELITMAFGKDLHPLVEFTESSMAVVTLSKIGQVKAFRNGLRPLWITVAYNGTIATSTSDIVERSGFEYKHHSKTIPGVEYNLSNGSVVSIVKDMEDLQ